MTTDHALANLQELVRIPTISRLEASETDWAQFDTFLETLAALYPVIHSTLEREVVAGHSLLFRWPGRSAARPSVLMAHYDVVAATDDGWEHPPFAADVTGDGEEQIIWGRGTVDNKGAIAAILEAVEGQLTMGRTPFNDIYLSFGHDEEAHGSGALAIVGLLAGRGVRPGLVLDHGGAIVQGAFPGVKAPVAAVGVSEKGSAIVRLTVEQPGGFASAPPSMTSPARLARAIVRLNSKPFGAAINPGVFEMFQVLGRHTKGVLGFALRNLNISKPLLLAALTRMSDETKALTRSTHAVTMFSGGLAVNALAERATALVSVRIVAGSTVSEAVEHVRGAINDEQVSIVTIAASEPSPMSPATGEVWELLAATIERSHPGTVVAPCVQSESTDGRRFTLISNHVYRFTPFEISLAERGAMHAVNERLHVAAYFRGIEFYRALLAAL